MLGTHASFCECEECQPMKQDRIMNKILYCKIINKEPVCPACGTDNIFKDSDGWWYCNDCGEVWEEELTDKVNELVEGYGDLLKRVEKLEKNKD